MANTDSGGCAVNINPERHRDGEEAPIVRAVPPWTLWASIAAVIGFIATGVGWIFQAGAATEAIKQQAQESKNLSVIMDGVRQQLNDMRVFNERQTGRIDSLNQRVDNHEQRLAGLEGRRK